MHTQALVHGLRAGGALLLGAALAAAEPVTTVRSHGQPANRVDVVILGDGYTAAELAGGKYAYDVESMVGRLFAQEPYAEYQRYFNVHRIDVTSVESGADHPSLGLYRDTALGAAYDCAGIQRLICVDTSAVNAVIGRTALDPNAKDLTIVLVNDPEYGGSGGAVAVASLHSSVVELVLHEVGHTFGQLADEYSGGGPSCQTSEPAAANATMVTTRADIKWAVWIDPATPIPTPGPSVALPGLYEGAVYCYTGMYRPTYNSKMRSLGVPFEQINVEAHVKRIYNRVSPIDNTTPAPGPVQLYRGQTRLFTAQVVSPLTHAANVTWFLNGVPVGSGAQFAFRSSRVAVGSHTLSLVVSDPTPLVRNDPSGVLRDTRTFQIALGAAGAWVRDHDGDSVTDLSVFRPSTGVWYVAGSLAGPPAAVQWGAASDIRVPGDYDGDGTTDAAVYRPSTGTWLIVPSSTGVPVGRPWGVGSDTPVPADYDGDGRTDLAVFRPSVGTWFIVPSSTGTPTAVPWGQAGDVPVPGDFDGDGKADPTVFRPATGTWYEWRSATASAFGLVWGAKDDVPLAGDYDGDGKADPTLFRPASGAWYQWRSATGTPFGFVWGQNGDMPVVGDYDGDGIADPTLFRPTTGQWFQMRSATGTAYGVVWGAPGDLPM